MRGGGGDNERPKRLYISLMVGQKRMRGVGGLEGTDISFIIGLRRMGVGKGNVGIVYGLDGWVEEEEGKGLAQLERPESDLIVG